jgi:uncharacterized protein
MAGALFGVPNIEAKLSYVLIPGPTMSSEGKTEEARPMMGKVDDAAILLDAILAKHSVCKSHGIGHAKMVMMHAQRALRSSKLKISESERLAVLLAALLHDADDRKFFPRNHNYENARDILKTVCSELEARVVTMIGYVSAAKNGDTKPEESKESPWVLYPRYADRLEAIGWIGVVRCWEYTLSTSRPLFTENTPVAKNKDELWKIATVERFTEYKGNSASMVDHYYDKLLRIGLFESGNSYLDDEAAKRQEQPIALCLKFGEGKLTDAFFELAQKNAPAEANASTEAAGATHP